MAYGYSVLVNITIAVVNRDLKNTVIISHDLIKDKHTKRLKRLLTFSGIIKV